jgi:hypothetical protein
MLRRRFPNLAHSVAPDSRPALRESWRRSWPNRQPRRVIALCNYLRRGGVWASRAAARPVVIFLPG